MMIDNQKKVFVGVLRIFDELMRPTKLRKNFYTHKLPTLIIEGARELKNAWRYEMKI